MVPVPGIIKELSILKYVLAEKKSGSELDSTLYLHSESMIHFEQESWMLINSTYLFAMLLSKDQCQVAQIC